jgi:PAS domain S-box-containing protein
MGKPLKVLLIEDCDDDEYLIIRALKNEGYELTYARVENARDMSKALNRESWDIVISDYSLPKFNGEEALKLLRKKDKLTPFILVSGAVGEDVAVMMMREGANDYIMKQNLRRLGAAIERELTDTETKRREIASHEEIKELSLVAKHTSNQVIITDAHGLIIWVNQAFTNTTGYTLDEVKEKKPGDFLQGAETNAETVKYMRTQIRKQEPFNCEIINYSKTGEKYWLSMHAEPIFNNNDKLIKLIAIQRNITDQKKYEAQLKKLNEELEAKVAERTRELNEANKELEAFNFTVSHDLRTPVHFTNTLLKTLIEKYSANLPDEGKKMIHEIRKTNIRLSNQINDLLAFSLMGKRVKQSKRFSMEALFRAVFEELKNANGIYSNVQFHLHQLPEAYGDSVMLKHVVQNLLSNALKYSGKNPNPVIEVSGTTQDEENIYSVKDNGVGFDMKHYDKLFETFERLHTDDEFEGTGAGLAIVQRIVLRHGGRVWAESAVGKGATFYFSLPELGYHE